MSGISLTVPMLNYGNYIKDCYNKYNVTSSDECYFNDKSDVIVINIGTNDAEGILNNKGSVEQFIAEYTQLIAKFLTINKDAHIICVYGMMSLGNPVNAGIKAMVSEINLTDSKVYALALGNASIGYPSMESHQKAGEALANFIESLI